jgi:uncharacterized protein
MTPQPGERSKSTDTAMAVSSRFGGEMADRAPAENRAYEGKRLMCQSILWRRLDQPGHESSRLSWQHARWHLAGTAVFAHHLQACRLDYLVVCDAEWHTIYGKVAGWVGNQSIAVALSADPARRWLLNGMECPAVAGSLDLDLNFSPSTNLLAIRRLDLAIGMEAEVQAAWLRFPEFTLEPLVQLYRRISEATYRYESGQGTFVAELQVNPAGFVTSYPNGWQVEESAQTTLVG